MSITELERARCQFPSVQGVITYSLRVWERIERGTVVLEKIEPYNKWIPQGMLNLFRMAASNMFPPISFVFRREVLNTVGNYCEELPVLGDWEFNLRFMTHFDIFVVPYALAFYHHRMTVSGPLGNSVISEVQKHDVYDQYIRNYLLRQDIQGATHGLGTVVNLAKQLELNFDQLRAIESRVSSRPVIVPASRYAERGAPGGLPAWIVVSVTTFFRSGDKGSLANKFFTHLRKEGPFRALSVVARFGYLAAGGK